MNALGGDKLVVIAQRVITNGHWASIYFGCFDGSNQFHQKNSQRLDGAAGELLYVLDRGLPRLAALCLCRLWDRPGRKNDRHSLPTLIGQQEFVAKASECDPSFVVDCEKLSGDGLIGKLRNFRIQDLAHNLPFGGEKGLTNDELRKVLLFTQPILNRLIKIMKMDSPTQDFIYRVRRDTAAEFWLRVAPVVLLSDEHVG